ncbi:MAG: hypothetical protein AAF514_04335 [Verrucomicrobiota bacterium]
MIKVQYRARLGNNLYQYALGRLLAERMNYELEAPRLPDFPVTAERVEGRRFEEPEVVMRGNFIDLEALVAEHDRQCIFLNGYFQHHGWCWPRREFLRGLYRLDPEDRVAAGYRDEVVVNVRRTDYVGLGWALPFSFYEEAIRLSGASRVWIVTDDRWDPFFLKFRPYRPRFFSGPPAEQIRFMAGFEKIVLSASTFSWWAAVLGNPTHAFTPMASYGCWSGEDEDGPNLIPDDRPFVRMPVEEPYRPTRAERLYQEGRRLKKRLRQELGLKWTP